METKAPRTRFGLIFAVVVVTATVGMWIYLFLIADPNVPDQLDDEAFPADGRITGLWLDDWETYIGDRERYADALAEGDEAELLVTARATGGQITETIDHFAEINNMEDCAVPLDVG